MRMLTVIVLVLICLFVFVGQIVAGEHPGKPTIKPTVLNHKHLSWGSCRCPMCLGQHLRNYHGQKTDRLDAVGFRNWSRYHRELHRTGVYKAPKRSGCPGGVCPAPRRRLQYRLFRRWRR